MEFSGWIAIRDQLSWLVYVFGRVQLKGMYILIPSLVIALVVGLAGMYVPRQMSRFVEGFLIYRDDNQLLLMCVGLLCSHALCAFLLRLAIQEEVGSVPASTPFSLREIWNYRS
eukprot:TRINITY_DN4335_c0_g1_i1.p1 TRINITY_DN4335_c0_g1~~TRINITY_DN4335_c0_g1_i1.p1  ORF type:complete len:114 (+),score=10.23 TRINITY_DN4335_c0_g1_i1:24-365(+)